MVYGVGALLPACATSMRKAHPKDEPEIEILPRERWTSAGVDESLARGMDGVSRITIHHEGSPNVRTAASVEDTAALLERIRRFHVEARGWADIAYHYVIDPDGRVWKARPIRYQGAHVKNQNEHNLGVLVLGNFEIQEPSAAQLARLPELLRVLREEHGVKIESVRSHLELAPTLCPGRNLQTRFVAMRERGAI